MPMLNPCCCISPRIGTFVFAILDFVLIAPYCWAIIDNWANKDFQYELLGEVILCVCVVLFALLLLFGAIQNSQEKIRLWLWLWVIFLLVALVFQILNISTNTREEARVRVGSSFGGIVLFIYQLCVVYAYLTELREGSKGITYFPARIAV